MELPEDAVPRATGFNAWWAVRGRSFLGTAAVTSVTIVVIGWMTGLRAVMHAAILSVATVALLPFVLVASGLLLLMGIGFVFALLASLGGEHLAIDHGLYGAGELWVGGGRWFASRYYRFMARQRHPLFWGFPAGVLFGGLILWALIAALVLPGEARTARILGRTMATIDQIYRDTGEFPPPDAHGHLTGRLSDGNGAAGTVLVDGFGQPLHYEVSGRWKLASWLLVSSGFDGKAGADDLCVSGTTKLAEWAEQATEFAHLLESIGAGTASTKDELAGIRALKCPRR